MAIISPCPDARTLDRVRLGELSLREVEELAQHLEQCDRCVASLQEPWPDDTLVGALRAQKTPGSPLEPDVVAELIATLKKLPAPAPGPLTQAASDRETPCASSAGEGASSLDSTQDEYAFLAPAEGPGEMGRLGLYRVLRPLGAGGMGVVFAALDPQLGRTVAVKVMRPRLTDSVSARQRFLREARAMAALKHDHIVTIYQVGEERGAPYLAMELLEGASLEGWLKRGWQPTLAEVLRIGREIASGLAAAHDKGLIHRDIKASNIWLEGETAAPAPGGSVKILDFGLARPENVPSSVEPLTEDGAIVGTPAYMAPEQAQGETVDHRCDLFSLGCVLFRLLTGELPWNAPTPMAYVACLTLRPARPILELRPDLPPPLADLVMRLLARDPKDRPASAREVAAGFQAIERDLHNPGSNGTLSLPPLSPGLRGEGPGKASTPTLDTETKVREGSGERGERGPARRPKFLATVAAGVLVVGSLLAIGSILFFQTSRGTIRIEINDPGIKAAMDTDGFTITADENTNLRIDPGEHFLRVKRGDLEFKTDAFSLKKGGLVILKVELVDGKVQVVKDDQVIGTTPPIDPCWFEEIAQLPAEQQVAAVARKLQERNPGFDGKVNSRIEGGVVTQLEFLTDQVTDLSPVRVLGRLRVLHCNGSKKDAGQLADLSPLQGMKLMALRCRWTKVSDLSPLKDMMLTGVICSGTQVSDLSPLKGMPLTILECEGTRVFELSPLRGMPLATINFGKTQVIDLSPLKGMPLTSLLFDGSKVSDLSPLRGMPLKALVCSNSEVSELSWLKGMSLARLYCGGTRVTDLSPLEGMPLTTLEFNSTRVSELSALRGMKLIQLQFNYTGVSDLSPLRGMPLTLLNCCSTQVSDLSPLLGMKLSELVCNGARVSDLSPLQGMPLQILKCDFKPERDTEILRSIKTLKQINLKPVAEFWKEVDARQPGKP